MNFLLEISWISACVYLQLIIHAIRLEKRERLKGEGIDVNINLSKSTEERCYFDVKKKSLCLPLLFRNESIRKIRRQLRIEQRGTTASKQGGGRREGGRTETDEFRSEAKRREYLEMGQSGALLRFDDNEPKVMPLGVCFSAPGK